MGKVGWLLLIIFLPPVAIALFVVKFFSNQEKQTKELKKINNTITRNTGSTPNQGDSAQQSKQEDISPRRT